MPPSTANEGLHGTSKSSGPNQIVLLFVPFRSLDPYNRLQSPLRDFKPEKDEVQSLIGTSVE
jgi:hypothetical protein